MEVGSGGNRGDQVGAGNAAQFLGGQFLGDRERDRHRGDPDMTAGADIVVIEHVAEAAIDKGGPWRRRV
jgi:hypothetical protein